MNLFGRVCLYFAAALALIGGIAYVELRPAPVTQPPQRKTVSQNIAPVLVEDEMSDAKAAIGKQVLALLAAGKYSELDALAAELRRSQAAFVNGYWSLSLFYQAASDLGRDALEEQWQTRVELVRRWFEEDPDCITPRVAMARALVGYAWHARGIGWAADVPRDAWQPIYERVTEANRILKAAKALPEKCPCWYSTWMMLAMLGGASHEQYDEVWAEGMKSFPSYTPFYLMKTWYLQERWYGEPGEWQNFAKESADQLGGEKGDVIYAQIVWYVHDLRFYGNPIGESGVEWPRVQRGFEAIRRRYPHSLFALSEYCSISGFAPTGARPLMRRLFAEVNNRVDLRVWQEMELFRRDQS